MPILVKFQRSIVKNFLSGRFSSDMRTRLCKECFTAYCAKNKEKIAAYRAEYYAKNKEKSAARSAEYYAKNKEKIAARRAEYYAKNKEKIAARRAAYRARKKREKHAASSDEE